MDSPRNLTPGNASAPTRSGHVPVMARLCGSPHRIRIPHSGRILIAAVSCVLFARHAYALPLVFGCASPGLQVSAIECRGTLPALAHTVDLRRTHSTFLNSAAFTTLGFPIDPNPAGHIFFSMTTDSAGPVVIALMRNEPLRSGLHELSREGGTDEAFGKQTPDPRAATLLLITSGLAGLSATARRRRSLTSMRDMKALWSLPKEVSSSPPFVARLSRSAQGSSHLTPLRI